MAIAEFEMTDFIKWKDYKKFLNYCQNYLPKADYELMLPHLPESILNDALNSSTYDEKPVTGVSWTCAHYFAEWATIEEVTYSVEFLYRLPSAAEWVAARKQLDPKKSDLDKQYADWTTTAKDESLPCLSYNYSARRDDPPSMKRKLVLGKFFAHRMTI